MARKTGGTRGDVRQSALWGSGNRGGEFRTNALWGKGGKGTIVLLVMLVLPAPLRGCVREEHRDREAPARRTSSRACSSVRSDNPHEMFHVIVQSTARRKLGGGDLRGRRGGRRAGSRDRGGSGRARREEGERGRVQGEAEGRSRVVSAPSARTGRRSVTCSRGSRSSSTATSTSSFDFIKGVSLEIAGRRLARLAHQAGPDDHRGRAGQAEQHGSTATSGRRHRASCPCSGSSSKPAPNAPAIAIVDSGIAARPVPTSATARGSLARKVITTSQPNSAERRARSRHVRGEHRRGQRSRPARRLADLADRRRRRDGRQRQGADERRHRGCGVDPQAQGRAQHPRRELLAPFGAAEQLHEGPARQGGREALVRRRRRRRGGRQLRHARTGRAASSSRPATIRS